MNARDPKDIGNAHPLNHTASTKRRKLKGGGPRPMALEQRIVFDGAGVDSAVAATLLADRAALDAASARDAVSDASQATAPAAYSAIAAVSPARPEGSTPGVPTFAVSPREIAFIDQRVPDWQKIIDGLSPSIEVVLIDGNEDGLARMLDAVRNSGNKYSAVHIFSHGGSGSFQVGSSLLDAITIDAERNRLALLGERLTADADILLYGCDVAADATGIAFIGKLARATGADVAASSDLTGAARKGGDWVLEQQTGHIETAVGLTVAAQGSYSDILADNTAPSFSTGDGKTTTDFAAGNDYGSSSAIQSDGKVLVAGVSYIGSRSEFSLARYSADGSLDVSFGNDGKLTTTVGSSHSGGRDVAVQADGKIIVGGFAEISAGINNFALVRYNADGSLDTSFGTGGKKIIDMVHTADARLALQSDGKILLGGTTAANDNFDFALVRLNSNGSLDTTFATGGMLTTDLGSIREGGNDIAVLADGTILVAGVTENNSAGGKDFALVSYNSNGSLNTSFGTGGIVITAIGAALTSDIGKSVTVQADGKILVAGTTGGSSSSDFALARYNSNGSLDTGFGTGGKIITAVGTASDTGQSVTVQSDGKIIVAGYSLNKIPNVNNGTNDFSLVRYTSSGSVDTSFGISGKVLTTVWATSGDEGRNVIVQADGKILLVGASMSGPYYDFALVRYNSDGSLDTSFGPDSTLTNRPLYNPGSVSVVLDSKVLIRDSELDITGNYSGSSLSLSRNGGANSQDSFDFNLTGASFTASGGNLLSGGSVFATWALNSGTLSINFTGSATRATKALVQDVMQRIRYGNTSNTPPTLVKIDWSFSDGNTGSQGTGGSKSVVASTTIDIGSNASPIVVTSVITALTDGIEGSTTDFSAGNTLASIVPASAITDSNGVSISAIAIVAADDANGVWQYSLNNGSSWFNVGTRSDSNALLLDGTQSGTATNKLRFIPNGHGFERRPKL